MAGAEMIVGRGGSVGGACTFRQARRGSTVLNDSSVRSARHVKLLPSRRMWPRRCRRCPFGRGEAHKEVAGRTRSSSSCAGSYR
eukprot:6134709-Pyramimonas_sp.AAC.1